jgi:hypothetical protein
MENFYNSLKVFWNSVKVADDSMGFSMRSVKMAYCHFGGVTRIPSEEGPAAPWSSGVVRCCGLPITLLLVNKHASSRIILTRRGVTMGSPANISGDATQTLGSVSVVDSALVLGLPTLVSVGAEESGGTDKLRVAMAMGSTMTSVTPDAFPGLGAGVTMEASGCSKPRVEDGLCIRNDNKSIYKERTIVQAQKVLGHLQCGFLYMQFLLFQCLRYWSSI